MHTSMGSCCPYRRGSCRLTPASRLAAMMDPKAMPFDVKRMVYGGFRVIVDL